MEKTCQESSGGGCQKERVITKFTEYVGSFAVKETDSKRRVWIIEEQMRVLKDCGRRRPVILKFCLQGVKMYDADGETLLMAHALRRIQYTTCRLEDSQFAFVSRNPQGQTNQLFCHLYVGSQPSEAQVLNLLLCRSFQLLYLAIHPEVGEQKSTACKPQRQGIRGVMAREPLDPGEVSQNVKALVSFKRLSVTAEVKNGSDQTDALSIVPRSSSVESHCSPTLVRKKAIRSKVIRSGAYRCPKNEPDAQKRGGKDGSECVVAELSEKLEDLQDTVWSCAGVERDQSINLLKNDRMGAFLIRSDPECGGQFTLYMSTKCGVIPYKIYTTPQASYYIEHLPPEFASLTDLVAHHSGTDSSLFFQLAHGRVNPCYETQDTRTCQQRSHTQHKSILEPKLKDSAETEQSTNIDLAAQPVLPIYHI